MIRISGWKTKPLLQASQPHLIFMPKASYVESKINEGYGVVLL